MNSKSNHTKKNPSNSNSNSNSNSSSVKHSTRNVGRVADYFAILGIGKSLQLKKKNFGNFNSKHDSSLMESWRKEQEEEEECSMVERFYREITDLCLLTVYMDETTQYYIGATISTTEDSDSDSDAFTKSFLESSSAAAAALSSSTLPSLMNLHTANQQKKIPSPIMGYTILSQTVPAGDPSQKNNHKFNSNSNHHHASFLDNNTSLNDSTLNNQSMSLSMNSTFDSKHASQQLWKKYAIFDADLSPQTGVRSVLCSTLFQGGEEPFSTHASFSVHDSFMEMNPSSVIDVDSKQNNTSPTKPKSGFSLNPWSKMNLSSAAVGITAKWKDQLSPLLATKSKAVVGKEGFFFPSAFTVQESDLPIKQFYIGYRKRGPDEADKPGVANISILFCKIHKATILESPKWEKYVPPELNKDLISSGSTVAHQDVQEQQPRKAAVIETFQNAQKGAAVLKRGLVNGADAAKRVVASGGTKMLFGRREDSIEDEYCCPSGTSEHSKTGHSLDDKRFEHPSKPMVYDRVALKDLIEIPSGYEDLLIPDMYKCIQLPVPSSPRKRNSSSPMGPRRSPSSPSRKSIPEMSSGEKRMQKTFLLSAGKDGSVATPRNTGAGIEAVVDSNTFLTSSPRSRGSPSRGKLRKNPWSPVEEFPVLDEFMNIDDRQNGIDLSHIDRELYMPVIVNHEDLPRIHDSTVSYEGGDYEYIPIVAFRRQRVSEEERFHEDPSIVDIGLSFSDFTGKAVLPPPDDDEDDAEQTDGGDPLIKVSSWKDATFCNNHKDDEQSALSDRDENEDQRRDDYRVFGLPKVICKRNSPIGFLDTPFATGVLDRFPKKDYKGVPLPEEELPMFCYPTGCRLFRAKYQDAPLPEYYGFVVKNERGESIYVSCVSFMEPLESSKIDQLNKISQRRRRTSLPDKAFCERLDRERDYEHSQKDETSGHLIGFDHFKNDLFLIGFDEMLTFEKKTICLISRYPFWSAFRRFLSHLQILSGSSSELPLERYISHLLLTVPLPKPGHQCILIPLPAIASPMVLGLPPLKDLPLVDISFRRLFSCLDVPTVVTIVLGFLSLERKVIVMSTFSSLVSDVCELLRALLFPFDLCAPYVPRLTEPFMSCLNFPGAIFVGIHDDGSPDGLAACVRSNIPDEAFVVDLDTGDIDCGGDRFEVLKDCWDIIPHQVRSLLVEEVETLCEDASLTPGEEPSGFGIEAALDTSDVSFSPLFGEEDVQLLDDRAIRDAFLRFFCSVLGGYERFLLVPDIDFLISGNEWFDTKGFVSATEKQERGPFVHALTATQLFQSFIQRRTESGDVHCLLFDECLSEFHSAQSPYGRLAPFESHQKADHTHNYPPYELLVDQCAAELSTRSDVDESSSAEISILTAHTIDGFMINSSGDLVTAPSKKNLPPGNRYIYCEDGHPHFPQELDIDMFYPEEPQVLKMDIDEVSIPILSRSDRELDASNRRFKMALSQKGVQRQRRCLFQLPKLMASQFLNAWLMCIPSQVTQPFQSKDQQITYLLRALGALRLLRSQHRIVPDEAGYRCLIMACGRTQSDRRQDVVKLFGLMRSDGIFPSAVTLGQYTRGIAEGYAKQSSGKTNSIISEPTHGSVISLKEDDIQDIILNLAIPNALDFLDGNLVELDEIGSRWRQSRDVGQGSTIRSKSKDQDASKEANSRKTETRSSGRKANHPWLPVCSSSSFSPHWKPNLPVTQTFDLMKDFCLVGLWSRATQCSRCAYVLLDEEIQAGWDDVDLDEEGQDDSVKCPCCQESVHPRLGYIETPPLSTNSISKHLSPSILSKERLPPQVQKLELSEDVNDSRQGYVSYLSPSMMRLKLERIVEDLGEEVLEREKLRYLNPTVFFNLWWYCSRFSLPLPLAVALRSQLPSKEGSPVYDCHCCAFSSWEKATALSACRSAVKTIAHLQSLIRNSVRPKPSLAHVRLVTAFSKTEPREHYETSLNPLSRPFPLLAHINLSSMGQDDWDNKDLSSVLIHLLDACDKRDFVPAIEEVLKCNSDRRARFGSREKNELETYRTLLYLSRYQCPTAFHTFFPSTSKVCKGYHFWCPNATISIFDRMFRDALDRIREKHNTETNIHDISDIALGFRSVFGHLI